MFDLKKSNNFKMAKSNNENEAFAKEESLLLPLRNEFSSMIFEYDFFFK
jgi:hypothetical protein